MTDSTTVSATLAALGASGWSVNGGYGADGFEALPVIGTVSADPTGVSDASLAFSMIVAKAGGRRGIIIVPPGKFTAQGIPCYPGLYFQGAGRGALDESTGTSINLPAGATSNMFLCTSPTNDFIGGGVADMDLNGGLLRTASPTRSTKSSPVRRACSPRASRTSPRAAAASPCAWPTRTARPSRQGSAFR